MGSGHEPVELYGIIEIANALGVDRRKVAVWHGRSKLPPSDFRASGRPFWKPETITPWIAAQAHTQQTTLPEPVAADLAATADQPARPRSSTSGRRASAVDQDQDRDGDRGEDPYELTRCHGGRGWTLTYLGRPIGTVRPAWSATGRSKRWQAYSPQRYAAGHAHVPDGAGRRGPGCPGPPASDCRR